MLQHQFEGILARFLAQIGQDGDVSPDDGLQRSAKVPDNASRPDDNPADNPEIPDNAIPRQLIGGAHHCGVDATIHDRFSSDSHLLVRFYTHMIRSGVGTVLLR
jgi:hypothetical protein